MTYLLLHLTLLGRFVQIINPKYLCARCCELFKSSPKYTVNNLSNELISGIQDAIKFLENYRSFGPTVEDGIATFTRINECVLDSTPEKVEEAKYLIAQMQRDIGPYKSMVPQVTIALDRLSEWSKEN